MLVDVRIAAATKPNCRLSRFEEVGSLFHDSTSVSMFRSVFAPGRHSGYTSLYSCHVDALWSRPQRSHTAHSKPISSTYKVNFKLHFSALGLMSLGLLTVQNVSAPYKQRPLFRLFDSIRVIYSDILSLASSDNGRFKDLSNNAARWELKNKCYL